MSTKEELLPEVSDIDLNLEEEIKSPSGEGIPANTNTTMQQSPMESSARVETSSQDTIPEKEPLSETKLMHDRIDELSNALKEEKRKTQMLNNQLAMSRQQTMQQTQELMQSRNPLKRSPKGFIRDHKQVLIIVIILLVVALVAALLVNKTSSKKTLTVDENDEPAEAKD